jgi:hypothetical protein
LEKIQNKVLIATGRNKGLVGEIEKGKNYGNQGRSGGKWSLEGM